ncbi:MAG: glycoside hydrolase family 9 protein [Oscillospiraceae bacterium]
MKPTAKKLISGICSLVFAVSSLCLIPSADSMNISAESDANYAEALNLSLYFFDANQCGNNVDDNALTWRGNCHTYDEKASLNSAQGLGSEEKEFIRNANGGSDVIDVSGGYHDAGDHIKFSMTMGYAATSLAWAYYEYPEAFTETGSKDHLFDILKEMCDYFMKVTYLDSNDDVVTFCYMVGGDNDHGEWSSPESQTMDRPTYWATKSKNSTDAACQMASALAASSLAMREVDSAYADECLKYANALQKFGSAYQGATYDGVGSYYSSGSQVDDVAWGDLWCSIANGTIDSYKPIGVNNGCYDGGNYDCWIYSWDKVWGGYAALLYSLGFESYGNELVYEMKNQVSDTSQAYYPVGGGWGASRYNCAWQMYALWYSKYSNTTEYAEYAKKQMNYLLGQNSANRSYLIGYTDTYPVHIHHRAANPNKDTMTHVLYGALVGGPTDASGSYDDNTDSYSCTEPALDYNGSFILAIAGLYSMYGGDTESVKSVISNASEIDENHKFGDWSGGNEPVVTTPEETTTTEETTAVTEDTTVTSQDTATVTTTEEPATETTTETSLTTDNMGGDLPEPTLMGDASGDNSVDVRDVTSICQHIVKMQTLTVQGFANADVNKDNAVDVKDLSQLKKFLINVIQEL